MTIVILTGPIGAGKSILAKALTEHGFSYMRFSDIIKTQLKQQNVTPTRENMQTIGAKLRQTHGPSTLGILLREKIQTQPPQNWCLDGARNPEEITELKKLPHVKIIGITAPLETLTERILSRQRDLDQQLTPQKAREKILIELGKIPHPAHFQIQKCLDTADLIIENTGTIPEAQQKLLTYLDLK